MSIEWQQYEHVLRGADKGWVLLMAPDLAGGYCVFDKLNSAVLLIEDEEENAAVCERMRQLGFAIIEAIPIRDASVEPA